MAADTLKIGDRVARIARDHYDGTEGTVIETAERAGPATGRDADRIVKPRARVLWDAGTSDNPDWKPKQTRSWIALDAEGVRWRRLLAAGEGA